MLWFFVSFAERISKISADITKWQTTLPAVTDQTETCFYDSLTKGRETDFGSYFESFLHDIPLDDNELRTYAQLLHHQKIVFEKLVQHLSIKESTSLSTILDVTIAFVRDLREDFKPYLWDVLEAVTNIIESHAQDAEILEVSFRALAIFFKLHWRTIVKELRRTFIRFQNLFSSSYGYIRRFISEAFAFLLRKSSIIGKVVLFMNETAEKVACLFHILTLSENIKLADGISELYFNALKGVMHQFHSSAPEVRQYF
uniref:Uncharacterized protein n=1 Tax=Syphacia muris TaxID=451379 RepID=A0A0N5ASA5_9BILA